METYKASAFSDNGLPAVFLQDNCAYSTHGVLRGLHYQQNPHAQGKLMMALRGEVFDVAVDIRKGSPTYGRWIGRMLSEQNGAMLYVPPGFAHGYCVVSEDAIICYKVTAEYAPEAERGIAWDDSEIGIEWPLKSPIVCERDEKFPLLRDAAVDFVME
jgi:dTDP-4-dehydrorhamnose 3,5-epimerase